MDPNGKPRSGSWFGPSAISHQPSAMPVVVAVIAGVPGAARFAQVVGGVVEVVHPAVELAVAQVAVVAEEVAHAVEPVVDPVRGAVADHPLALGQAGPV